MIEIREVGHRYAGAAQDALNGVSLSVAEGSAWGLLGANGAGKTTLMSLLAGLHRLQRGRILLDGTPLEQAGRRQRQRLSLVPQDFAFYPLLSVRDNMRFFAALYGIRDQAHLDRLLEETGLGAHRSKQAGQLSGGLKRRLNFAIGLINRPRMIFLDEITVGIDPESRQFILDSVAALSRSGVTVIYTSHYLQEIEQLCSHLALLDAGRLVYQGRLNDVLAQSPDTLYIETEPPLSDGLIERWHGRRRGRGAELPQHRPETVLPLLQAEGLKLTACRFGSPSLERFYLDFLGRRTEETR